MCKFLSCVSDGGGRIWYFDYEQRKSKVTMMDGTKIGSYDSHTSIAHYYGFKGEREDLLNKWEYNPFTDNLTLDKQNTADDREAVHAALSKLDLEPLCGDIESIRALIARTAHIPWFRNEGELPDGVQLYDTRAAARAAVRVAAWDAARDAAWDAARDAALDAALLSSLTMCAGLDVDPKHMMYAKKRWAVWEAGYGVLCDFDGVIYAYKKP